MLHIYMSGDKEGGKLCRVMLDIKDTPTFLIATF